MRYRGGGELEVLSDLFSISPKRWKALFFDSRIYLEIFISLLILYLV